MTAPPSNSKIKIQYRFIGSSDVNIGPVAYYEGNSPVSNASTNKGSTWTSPEVEVERALATGSANAIGATDNSTLKAQILQNGEVIKESGTSTGTILTTSVSLGN